jgi:hypothetical protein
LYCPRRQLLNPTMTNQNLSRSHASQTQIAPLITKSSTVQEWTRPVFMLSAQAPASSACCLPDYFPVFLVPTSVDACCREPKLVVLTPPQPHCPLITLRHTHMCGRRNCPIYLSLVRSSLSLSAKSSPPELLIRFMKKYTGTPSVYLCG